METEKKSNHGGKRPGAGRPKGSKQTTPAKPKKEYVCSFHVRCTSQKQYELLKSYWQTIKNIE
ncbi:MAG: hypothetical protein IKW45_03805 [Clostridia bacterium]|nr:hypothetical protein [Clostridia bacterium]